jgi:protein tyrosine/serine phosphatase
VACGPTIVVDKAKDGSPILIRSPQPDQEELERLDNQYGIETVINLRRAEIIKNSLAPWHLMEKKFCADNNITYLQMDLNDGTFPPSESDIDLFLHIVNTRIFWPVLIHCQGGIHRTGFFTALYRIQFNEWDAERAIEEMEDYWFNWGISDRSALRRYLRNYKRREMERK